jgi:hypothetical protein
MDFPSPLPSSPILLFPISSLLSFLIIPEFPWAPWKRMALFSPSPSSLLSPPSSLLPPPSLHIQYYSQK